MTLSERVSKDPRPLDADLCLGRIQNGIQHLHKLGLIILMSGNDDNPIITDFDSCRREGERLGIKAGTRGWTREDFKFATPENDQYGLSMIKDFVCQVKPQKGY
ncbi:hypothetical protein VC83_09619 [Pseudogymnoascus destructans]|uniref:Protein kinase domain-containing protein n=1 Tax=Pseudogymnoascus destructans TaxID=655981 RepID=A0A2P6FGI3_9PEZI|nr:uncharacterized protein VC83_09619 [Pseudogymnoascus destructans]PQM43492.1 hypothetical protein VC83_09619 [Pseudogymnoascus destructans]